ncbi:unnamed protein product [Phyllotreta striolata]|uniref:WH2 domain-containing protein n=1 Tax=Phyllotreta striolata TaxID=444603 RepID=A0A9N9XHH1_PHYSR|nr:unnamed protein product [Phyllotreta striolata]
MMLSTNVLCLKKKKKRTYSLNGGKVNWKIRKAEKNESDGGATVNMLQITEDTPPDMLAGAMDLTVHLPTGRIAKMSVERSTPMMDLLVQITTAHHLQLSNYSLQALGTAPSSDHRDKILPYKPNTPIGTLDTQHVKVVPKMRSIPATKNAPPGHQPFESTFRLKVHLPRNQLYVTRVSRNVKLEDIMNKVCEEKILDPVKYEFKHPGNLDETLDPKLTLSDYQITEIYVVAKGTVSLSQAFSSSDIMALRKEEERKQMHNKTGGGVFNLIFRRGKSSMGSGSVSSDTRSISPTHSDDSRSVTPPAVIQKTMLPPPKQDPPAERPKPPQRKRRPAPKPPQQQPPKEAGAEELSRKAEEKLPEENGEAQLRRCEGGTMISHSRTSSDSSGYHEASVLSENGNMSLPRRPKSAFVGSGDVEKLSKMHSQSTSNLSKMASHSKSTMSLGVTGRKKKAAPAPPPPIRSSNPHIEIETASPVVASQNANDPATHSTPLDTLVAHTAPKPLPRSKNRAPQIPAAKPIPRPRSDILHANRIETIVESGEERSPKGELVLPDKVRNEAVIEEIIKEVISERQLDDNNNDNSVESKDSTARSYQKIVELQKVAHLSIFASPQFRSNVENKSKTSSDNEQLENAGASKDINKSKPIENDDSEGNSNNNKAIEIGELGNDVNDYKPIENSDSGSDNKPIEDSDKGSNKIAKPIENDNSGSNGKKSIQSGDSESSNECKNVALNGVEIAGEEAVNEPQQSKTPSTIDNTVVSPEKKPPEIVGVIPKTPKDNKSTSNKYDSFGKRRFQSSPIAGSFDGEDNSSPFGTRDSSIASALNTFGFIDEFSDVDEKVFSGSLSSMRNLSLKENMFSELYGMHELESTPIGKNQSVSSLRSLRNLPGFMSGDGGMKKWHNVEELNGALLSSPEDGCRWVIGESGSESLASHQTLDSLDSSNRILSISAEQPKPFGSTDSGIAQETNEKLSEPEDTRPPTPPPPPLFVDDPPRAADEPVKDAPKEADPDICDIDWQYQLPSPPQAFRDSSPVTVADFKDSVVTSPELFEKRAAPSISSFDARSASTFAPDEPPLSTLSLEVLEKRKSLVYNRELSTSLKDDMDPYARSLSRFETAFVEVQKSSHRNSEGRYARRPPSATNTLPNFKISTYDRPKERIKVFEDDTIRSSEGGYRQSQRYMAASMESISVRKGTLDAKPAEKEYVFYKDDAASTNYGSAYGDGWSPSKAVSRSKSYLTLNGNSKYKAEKNNSASKGIERSNSLYDVSGLQSLGVMRLIQSKLHTPTSSLENLSADQAKPEQQARREDAAAEEPASSKPEKIYKYQGPPSINMSTWSERPKVPVAVKEDADYKLGNSVSSKLIVNTTNNSVTSSNTFEVKNNDAEQSAPSSVSIKVNGTEVPAENKPGNLVIKIDSAQSQPKAMDNQRFFNHMTAVGYRKPFTDVNKNERPHSVALGSDIDISRVPVVRSVELKKPFREFGNTTITQIGQPEDEKSSFLRFGKLKPTVAPVVRGFRTISKEKEAFVPNSQVPFSQNTLRRTASSAIHDERKAQSQDGNVTESGSNVSAPPPPPMMPKVNLKKPNVRQFEPVVDQRDQLLQAIRDFGGKKGLKTVNV